MSFRPSNSSGLSLIPPPPPPPLYDENYDAEAVVSCPLPSIKLVKNDYNQHFVDTGERPQNFIRDYEPHLRFTEYPRLGRLIRLKDELNRQRAHPPLHLQADFRQFDWSTLGCLFDVVLIDPPWREYAERAASQALVVNEDLSPWSVEDLLRYIRVDEITDVPSLCFIWCGSSHLDEGRQLLQAWGFRRCEDICWCKTNLQSSHVQSRGVQFLDEHGLFQRTKEHCLMGVKGAVKRSSDYHFIHSNIDTDIIVEEEPTDIHGYPTGSTKKPDELYEVIDRFCLGRRKIELFGTDRNIRPGWLTVGKDISVTNFDRERYISWVSDPEDSKRNPRLNQYMPPDVGYEGGRYVGSTMEIDLLRPRSPSRQRRS